MFLKDTLPWGIKKRTEITLSSKVLGWPKSLFVFPWALMNFLANPIVFPASCPPPTYQGCPHSQESLQRKYSVLINSADLGVRFPLSPVARPDQDTCKPLNFVSIFSTVK